MKLSQIITLLNCEVINDQKDNDVDISICICSDMMSDVLAFAKPGALLITGLTNAQSVRTADFADAAAVLYIRGKRPEEGSLELAEEMSIPILATEKSMFETCGILFREGLRGIC